jgi:hypothetical protein
VRQRAGTAIAAAGLLAALAGPASGQGKVALGNTGQSRVGEYSGVEPEKDAPPRPRPRHGKFPLVTWIGFQPQDGGSSRVFIQLDRDVTHHESVRGDVLVISLDGARYANTNARRPLDTRFFETAVARITTQPARRKKGARGSGVEVAIHFKNAGDARGLEPAKNIGKDGMVYLMFEVGPPGAAPAKASSADEPE